MPEFKLPRVRARDAITDLKGQAVNAFVRFWDTVAGAIERQEVRQDGVDVALQEQIDRINRILAGEEVFTGLNVGGTDVKPFLDKTDGQKIVLTDAFGNEVVLTGNIVVEGVTTPYVAISGGVLDLKGNSGRTLLQTLVVSPETGERVDILGNASITYEGTGSDESDEGAFVKYVSLEIWRDGSLRKNMRVMTILRDRRLASGPTIAWSETPGAGTYTYELWVDHGTNDDQIEWGEAADRYLQITRVKR